MCSATMARSLTEKHDSTGKKELAPVSGQRSGPAILGEVSKKAAGGRFALAQPPERRSRGCYSARQPLARLGAGTGYAHLLSLPLAYRRGTLPRRPAHGSVGGWPSRRASGVRSLLGKGPPGAENRRCGWSYRPRGALPCSGPAFFYGLITRPEGRPAASGRHPHSADRLRRRFCSAAWPRRAFHTPPGRDRRPLCRLRGPPAPYPGPRRAPST